MKGLLTRLQPDCLLFCRPAANNCYLGRSDHPGGVDNFTAGVVRSAARHRATQTEWPRGGSGALRSSVVAGDQHQRRRRRCNNPFNDCRRSGGERGIALRSVAAERRKYSEIRKHGFRTGWPTPVVGLG